MPGGRPRKPRALKLVQGTDRPDRANKHAPPLHSAPLPAAPRHLTAHEKAAWRQLAAVVDLLKVARPADLVAFEQMAVSLGMVESARASLKKSGGEPIYEVMTESGLTFRKRPEIEIIATFQKILAAQLGRFGLTPAEAEKVSRDDDSAAVDPLDEFAPGGTGAA